MGYNHNKRITLVVNDNLRKYNNALSDKGLPNVIQKRKDDDHECEVINQSSVCW